MTKELRGIIEKMVSENPDIMQIATNWSPSNIGTTIWVQFPSIEDQELANQFMEKYTDYVNDLFTPDYMYDDSHMLLCSCGRNLPDSEQVIKRYLKEKYNQEFQIVHTERKNIGQNFGEFINTGEAVSLNESDDAFSFTIYEDGRITDNYPKVILGNQIKQDIYSILDHGKLEYTNVDIRFIESDQEYVTFEDYKSNHNVLIFSDLKGLETNVDKNIENAYDLLCALRDQGYYFCLTIDIDKASKTIIYDQDNEMISKDSFIQKFS